MMHGIEASVMIEAPVATCYQAWHDFERFPEFMPRVERVERLHPADYRYEKERKAREESHRPDSNFDDVTAEWLDQVARHGGQIYRWTVKGPLGRRVEWIAGIVLDLPNTAISWASPADQSITTSGSVNFLKQPDDTQTLMEVKLSFSGPNGPLGELVSDITRYGDTVVYECLEDFKRYVERNVHDRLNPAERGQAGHPMKSEAELRQEAGTPEVIRGESKSDYSI